MCKYRLGVHAEARGRMFPRSLVVRVRAVGTWVVFVLVASRAFIVPVAHLFTLPRSPNTPQK